MNSAKLVSGSVAPEGLIDFFEKYRDAFNRLHPDDIAALYAVPSGILSGGTYFHWQHEHDVAINMKGLCAHYRGLGYESAAFRIDCFVPLGPQSAFVVVSWRITCAAGYADIDFRTAYNLVDSGRGWRVQLCTAYEEEQVA